MDESDRHLGHAIATRRRRLGMTQAQLAERTGVAVETISRLERGTAVPSLARLAGIARSLGVDTRELLDDELDDTPEARAIGRLLGLVLGRPVADVLLVADLAQRVFERLDSTDSHRD